MKEQAETPGNPGDKAHSMFNSIPIIAQMEFAHESPERIELFLQILVHLAVGGVPLPVSTH
jgi:hypothetical protein